MGRKKCFRRSEWRPVSSSPATAPPAGPASSKSEPATPFFPSSCYSKAVVLSEWWLIKSDTDINGKRLAVGGYTQWGKASRAFSSTPIVKRHDAFTVETADGINVRFHGFINKSLTHSNGFPPEVSRCFLIGFPFNWDCYADGDFMNKCTSTTIPTCASGTDEHAARLVDELGALFGLLRSTDNTLVGDDSNVDFTCAPQNPNGATAVSTTLRDELDMHSSITNRSLRDETLVRDEVDGKNQIHENNAGCADGIGSGSGRIATGHAGCFGKRSLHFGSQEEILEAGNRAIMSNDISSTVNKSKEGQQEMSQGMHSRTFFQEGAELEKDNNIARSIAVKSNPDAPLPDYNEDKLNDENSTSSIASIVKGVDQAQNEHPQGYNQLEHNAMRFHNHVGKTKVNGVGIFVDFPSRRNSVGMDYESWGDKMSVSAPLDASFESPLSDNQRNTDAETAANSASLAAKIDSTGISPNLSGPLHSKYQKRLEAYARRSGNRAHRVRMDYKNDVEVREDTSKNESDSFTVNSVMVLDTAIKPSTSVNEGKIDDKHTITSTESAGKRVLSNLLPTGGKDSNDKLKWRREPYSLRSRDHGRTVENKTFILDNSRGRKSSEETDANPSASKMSEPLETCHDKNARKSCEMPEMKGKGECTPAIESRLEVEDDCIAVVVEHNRTNGIGDAEQRGDIHAQSPVIGDIQAGALRSKHQCNLQFCTTSTSTSSDEINKKGVDHSECTMSLRKTSINGPCKTSTLLSVDHPADSDDSVVTRPEKVVDLTRKLPLEISDDQDREQTEASWEAQRRKEGTSNTYKRKTIWGPSQTLESPLTRHKARKLAVISPELLDLKRSRSGRLLVPRIETWHQKIIYDMDRTIAGISGIDVGGSPCKGSKSEPQKKRRLQKKTNHW